MDTRPNILLILNDDMGFSDLGCYGGEVQTPNLNRLADHGLRYTQFYNTARCCPSRASLLTGLHPHQTGVGHMMLEDPYEGYRGDLNRRCVTIAEALKPAGYHTFMSGKWHVSRFIDGPTHSWPRQRGFDRYHGIISGAADYFNPGTLTRENERIQAEPGTYLTDTISDTMVTFVREHAHTHPDEPFFGYLAYTAPHWPLHAHPEDVERYRGRFDAGWDALRKERRQRMIDMGLLRPEWPLSTRDERVPPWEEEPNKAWQTRRMEVYAAQIDRMDQGIGRVLQALEETGQLGNTLILFLADNGGCAEELAPRWTGFIRKGRIGNGVTWDGTPIQYGNDPNYMPGGQDTYQSCGVPWANVQNTPFRLYKHWTHEGGIATPLIVHWPDGIQARGEWRRQPAQLPDILPTLLEVAGTPYPEHYEDRDLLPCEGFSLVPTFTDGPAPRPVLYWEHEGNGAVRRGKWKLVCRYPETWELYDMEADRTEQHDRAAEHPDLVRELRTLYEDWAQRCGVVSWRQLTAERAKRKRQEEADKEKAKN